MGYLTVTTDFAGLVDVSEAAGKVAALKDTKPVRRYFKDEKAAAEQEQHWRERIDRAIATAKSGETLPSQRDVTSLRRRLTGADPVVGRTGDEAPLDFSGSSSAEQWPPADDYIAANPVGDLDRYAALRDVVDELTRQSKTNVVARRTLTDAAGSCMEFGSYQMGKKDCTAAAECFEAAAIIRPESPAAHVALARVYAQLGDKRKARQSLQTAIAKGFHDAERIKQLPDLVGP